MAAFDMLLSCGFTKPIAKLTLRDVPQLVECVALHTTILSVKAELDHIMQGLGDAGVLDSLQKYPHLFRTLFVQDSQPLTAGQYLKSTLS